MSERRYPPETLRAFVRSLMEAAGCSGEAAGNVAESVVAASQRGVDSHGLQLVPFYLAQIADGRVNPREEGGVVRESGATLLYDGRNGLGQIVADRCCGHAVRLARMYGAGVAIARESNHFGAAAWWAQKISQEGLVGIVLCNASSLVPPWQSRNKVWGTNPICMSIPCEDPAGRWLLDMATTTVAMGKIYRASMEHKAEIPAGWAMDSEGRPTTSTAEALGGMLMPLGGYKGSGLAMMVEILCGVLSGGAFGAQLGGFRVLDRPFRASQFFLALDVERFIGLEEFRGRMRELVAIVKAGPAAAEFDEVLVAGDPEWRTEAERGTSGIPVSDELWEKLSAMAKELWVAVPGP
jgi:LDH2 family malate/lactate/ureidoglycolate dehydrogenase